MSCEYMKVGQGLPVCEPLNKLCTLCFLGNQNQYEEAKRITASSNYAPPKKND